LKSDGVTTSLGRSDVVFNYYYSGLAGIAARSSGRTFQVYGGLGIHGSALLLGMGSAYYENYISMRSYAVGVGMDLGCKLNITPAFYLNAGVMGAWDFYNYTDMKNNGYQVDYEYDSFRTFIIDPFVGLGFSWDS